MRTGAPAPGLRRLFRLGLRFGLVGAASVLVYFGVLVVLTPLIASTVVLTAVSYAASAAFNYLLQSTFTFGARAIDAGAVARYLVMHGACMTLNSLLMFGAVDLHGTGVLRAQVAVTAVVAATSFVLSCLWVYAPPRAAGGRRRSGQRAGL